MQRQTTQITKEQAAKAGKKWYLVDATDVPLGRLASQVAVILMGKNKVDYTPGVDCGDYVIVTNASKVKLTGNKKKTKNYYDIHSNNYGGLRTRSAKEMSEQHPAEMVKLAVWGMMPHGSLGRAELLKLHIFEGECEGFESQTPIPVEVADRYIER